MKANVTINMDNASFTADPLRELARTLDHLAQTIHERIDARGLDVEELRRQGGAPIFDVNGNTIGRLTVATTVTTYHLGIRYATGGEKQRDFETAEARRKWLIDFVQACDIRTNHGTTATDTELMELVGRVKGHVVVSFELTR